MATFDCGRQRYSMNFCASHQRPLQRRSYTGRKQTFSEVCAMSALPPKADMDQHGRDVC